MESVEIDIPEYDLRKLMSSKDPLACVHAYDVAVKIILPTLYGLRMCPDCPNCAFADKPCMDSFGSNATPMGGSMGRADAMIGATEAQKAEGVLHLHFFYFSRWRINSAALRRSQRSLENICFPPMR